VRQLQPTTVVSLVRFEAVRGEFSRHYFGQVDVRYGTGRVERNQFVASRLKWSGSCTSLSSRMNAKRR
jgi:hypothetical protein